MPDLPPRSRHGPARREVLAGAAGLAAFAVVGPAVVGPAAARPALDAAVAGFTGGAAAPETGITLEVSPIVENGNAVPLAVRVESPMTAADHVRRIALFNEKNPQSDIAVFYLGPRSGRAQVATRIRLATTQVVVAVAEMSDGSFRQARASVVVTLAACIEDLQQ